MTEKSEAGIVVIGAPRSGTTLLRRILNAHPRIACPGETFLLKAVAKAVASDKVADGIDYGMLGGLDSAGIGPDESLRRLREFAEGILADLASAAGKQRWASKTAVDSFYIPEIEKIFSGHVKFVCIVRHGLDTACSMQDLCEVNGAYIEELHRYITLHPAPLEAFSHAWSDVTRSILDFAERHPDSAFLLRYEDLVEEPARMLPSLFEFLDEEYDETLLDRVFGEVRVQGLGDWKTYSTSGINVGSVGRYTELSDVTISRLASIVNPVLTAAGYEALSVGPQPDPADAMRRYEMQLTLNAARAAEAESD